MLHEKLRASPRITQRIMMIQRDLVVVAAGWQILPVNPVRAMLVIFWYLHAIILKCLA
jgi:hypothetical protein